MESFIQPFVDYLKFEKRYSEHTVRSYHDDLLSFLSYLKEQYGDISENEVSASVVRSWLAFLKSAKKSSRSINRKISVLKSFFKYQLRTGRLENTPMTNIVSPKINKRLPVFVEQKDMGTLLGHVEFPETWNGQTEKLFIVILYNTGIRVSELVNIKESHIDFGNQSIKVLGKGNKERVIPISPEMAFQVKDYCDKKRKQFDKFDDTYLLVNNKGKKLYSKYVYLVVRKYLGEVTTVNKKSPHVLRHTFATHLTNNGAELNSVKELLGHSSLAATQVYTHNTIEKLKEVYKKAHPKA
ncbi:MAG TPA: site-specific tyrosine recombinase/integron integrase [Puia sp.]|nr:site-specific tyrosine recombinase/integron integrase [Puia sp.]